MNQHSTVLQMTIMVQQIYLSIHLLHAGMV